MKTMADLIRNRHANPEALRLRLGETGPVIHPPEPGEKKATVYSTCAHSETGWQQAAYRISDDVPAEEPEPEETVDLEAREEATVPV